MVHINNFFCSRPSFWDKRIPYLVWENTCKQSLWGKRYCSFLKATPLQQNLTYLDYLVQVKLKKKNKRSRENTLCFLNFTFHQIWIWHVQYNYKSITSSLHSALLFRLPVPCVSVRTRPKRSTKVEKNRASPWEGAPINIYPITVAAEKMKLLISDKEEMKWVSYLLHWWDTVSLIVRNSKTLHSQFSVFWSFYFLLPLLHQVFCNLCKLKHH